MPIAPSDVDVFELGYLLRQLELHITPNVHEGRFFPPRWWIKTEIRVDDLQRALQEQYVAADAYIAARFRQVEQLLWQVDVSLNDYEVIWESPVTFCVGVDCDED